ncbi:SMP-30/gluconolactonase/LRE family protein [Brevibacterium casei]|uniref:Sugar lactone lactonase YvrE n=1 Tax=Brevibacterium casei CIP 102111 TaxID=1255625 RepID=A0A2H1HJT2_9MICO|nr:SMP-30/gluconolactonase/LRE family protein [Brevibacterium casei]MCT1551340.1 SMP-30/gluconolactonase/LRE family protein [Brevibacterium casei]MCT1560668.1 SMP-30/gluconolactonase/LRE family protein [Brevibacterium casei]QPR38786.1 SMP-30/gluconolactonase/LRE family protein [Brevibacterium casei]QPR42951.1 SMP-30/gluconolactonase/LRE family protein [Brevibacterium casei]SMX63131.1 Sugar lactone lactonase YvrE [Brevibacterium casei CIP 102111]
MRAELFVPPVAFHAEGPVWWPDDGSPVANTLRYVDMLAGRILTVRPEALTADVSGTSAGSVLTPVAPDMVDALDVPGPVAGCLRPRVAGGIAVLTEHGLSVSDDPAGGAWTEIAEVVTDPDVRFNDGGCDPAGRFLAGTMRYDQGKGGGALYRITGDGSVNTVFDDVTISNGIAWTSDERRAFYNDTPTRSTWVLDWDESAGLRNARRVFTLDDDDPAGGPDGLCVDTEDNVWTAIYGGSRVECRDAAGTLLEVVDLPVTNVTACTFGGPDLRTLFITTTQENVEPGTQPGAGGVFAVTPGATGVPAAPFDG